MALFFSSSHSSFQSILPSISFVYSIVLAFFPSLLSLFPPSFHLLFLPPFHPPLLHSSFPFFLPSFPSFLHSLLPSLLSLLILITHYSILSFHYHILGSITGSYTGTPSSNVWDNVIFSVPNAATNVVITNNAYNNVRISKYESLIVSQDCLRNQRFTFCITVRSFKASGNTASSVTLPKIATTSFVLVLTEILLLQAEQFRTKGFFFFT